MNAKINLSFIMVLALYGSALGVGSEPVSARWASLPTTTYTIYVVDSIYYAEASPETGLPNFSNSDFVDLMDDVMGVVGCNGTSPVAGNKIRIKEGLYFLTKTWTIPPVQDFELDAGYALFNYNPTTGDAISIDSFMSSRFTFGIIVCPSRTSGTAVRIKPTNIGPDGLITGIFTSFKFGAILNNAQIGTDVTIDSSISDIHKCTFIFEELNQADIGIDIPGPVGKVVSSNTFNFVAHGCNTVAKIGSAVHAGTVNTNKFIGNCFGVDGSSIGLDIYGSRNIILVDFQTYNTGKDIIFELNAANNIVMGQISDGITNNSGGGSNRIYQFKAPVKKTIKVGASPFVYQNLDMMTEVITVKGGKVSYIYISADGINYQDTGVTQGLFSLIPELYIKVGYKVKPEMYKFY